MLFFGLISETEKGKRFILWSLGAVLIKSKLELR